MGAPTFWDNNDRAQKHIVKLNGLKKSVLPVVAFKKKVDDLGVMLELIDAAEGAEKDLYAQEVTGQVDGLTLGIAWAFSNNKKAVDWKLVLTGVGLQIAFAALVLLVPGGKDVFEGLTLTVC